MIDSAQPKSPDQSRKIAVKVVAVIVAFTLAVVGLIAALEGVAKDMEQGDGSVGWIPSYEPFYMLLIGDDSRKGTAFYTGKADDQAQHADIATLVRVDPRTYTITLITVPRDTSVDGARIADTLASGDPYDTIRAVEVLTGVDINYYMMTTFIEFHDLIENLNGVVVSVPKTVSEEDPGTAKKVQTKAGVGQTLNGQQALVLSRTLKGYDAPQDAYRQVNVRNIEIAMINRVLQEDFDIAELLAEMENLVETNMSFGLMNFMIVDFVAHKDEVIFRVCTGPYEGEKNDKGIWVIEADTLTWQELIRAVENDENPQDIVPSPQFKTTTKK